MSIDFTKPYAGNAPLKWDFTKPYGATGRAETKKAAPTYEEVMGAMARQGVGRPEQVLDVSDLAKSLAAGTGQVISTAGAAAEWLGAEGVARKLREIGGGISERYALEPVPWQGWRTLLDPEWYSRNVAQALPFSLLTIVPSLAVSAGTASLFGLGAFGKTVVGTLAGAATGGVLNRAMESAMEAGAAYEEALAKGMSPEKADKAADETFKKNMRLAGLDIAEIATAFLPGLKVASGVGRAALTAGRLLAAGGEEALEEMLQEKYQREALGEPFSVAAPQTQEAMAIGALMGVGLGGAGEANALIGRIAQDAAERLSQKQRAEYDALVRQKVAEGKPWLTAAREAFDAMAGQREVKEAVEGATRAVIARYTAPATFAEEAAPTMMPLPTESELRGRAAEYREALRELEVGDRVRLVGDETVYTVHDLPRAWQVTVRDERGRTKTVSKDDVIADYDILRARLAETRREETAKKPATEAKKPPTQAVSLTKPAEARTEVRAAPGPSEARIAPPEAPEATVERVPATVEARATPIETAARPRVEPGQTVYRTDTGEALTVVDARDPALVTLRNARGTELKLGRRWITTEAPARAETVQDIAGELREKAEALETVPPPEYTGKTPDVLKRTVRDIEHEEGRVAKAVREKYGEEGFVERQITGIANLLAEAQAKDEVRVTDAEVEKVLTATRAATTPLEQLKRWFHQAYAAFKDIFSYEWRLEEFPRFQDQIRRFQGAQRDAQVSALETYLAIVSPMDDPKLGPKRFKLFSRLVDLRDMLEDKRAGKRVPGDLTVEQLETAEKELMAKADETVKRALENHDRVFRAAWEELQRRGKVSAEREGRRHYYPHRVLDYARDIDAKFPGLAVKLKAPYRYYLKKRGGTTRMFDTDYLTVTMTHLTKFYLDNALDDFALEVARDYDIWPRLSDSERAALGKTPVAGKLYEIDGERYFGWSYDA
ncbi:MAG: hypothetical protein PHH57_06725, partial [Candidatus Omnitrophica bacterium]|nr:hypothetical protein [Candidatus Omnitrophota bacterium]